MRFGPMGRACPSANARRCSIVCAVRRRHVPRHGILHVSRAVTPSCAPSLRTYTYTHTHARTHTHTPTRMRPPPPPRPQPPTDRTAVAHAHARCGPVRGDDDGEASIASRCSPCIRVHDRAAERGSHRPAVGTQARCTAAQSSLAAHAATGRQGVKPPSALPLELRVLPCGTAHGVPHAGFTASRTRSRRTCGRSACASSNASQARPAGRPHPRDLAADGYSVRL